MPKFKITYILRFTIQYVSKRNTSTVQHEYAEVSKMETHQILSFETTSAVDKNSSGLIFEQIINETVDDVFSSLGTVCRWVIYDILEKKYELKRSDIAYHPKEFSEALEQIFGGAAAILEIQIMKKLHRKAPYFKYRPKGMLTFPDYVNALSRFTRR